MHTSSRDSSYNAGNANLVRKTMNPESASLPDHLYSRGLLGGRHSDIAIFAFGHKYKLHRLILDRAPFFATALSEPWAESTAKEVTLHPEEIDSNITRTAFELALKRLYGCDISEEEDSEAVGLFATACWLEIQDLVDTAVDSILRRLDVEGLSPIIRLVTNSYYGPAGERILSSTKSMLCRDGWEMAIRHWDGIPASLIQEIVGGDGFFVDMEWDRWNLARRLLDRRLKQQAIDLGLLQAGSRTKIRAPAGLSHELPRFNQTVGRGYSRPSSRLSTEGNSREKWLALYMHPDIEPLLTLLNEGIYYVHLEFEQIQHIRQSHDVFGLPVVPEMVILNALYKQMELRQKVVNARPSDLELGLSQSVTYQTPARQAPDMSPSSVKSGAMSSSSKGKSRAIDVMPPTADETDAMPSTGNETDDDAVRESDDQEPPRFWIPSMDCNIVMGGNAEPVVTTGSAPSALRLASRLSGTIDPREFQLANDLFPSTNVDSASRTRPPSGQDESMSQPIPSQYTYFPPFRFAAEFPAPRLLKEKKRVYSRTVFYAGSLWNIYIQKMRAAKNLQLGVYLHRAKEREPDDGVTTGGNMGHGSVDERIGLLEREMLMRSEQRRGVRARQIARARRDGRIAVDGSSRSTLAGEGSRQSAITAMLRPRVSYAMSTEMALDSDSDSDDSGNVLNRADPTAASGATPLLQSPIPALPTYQDARTTIRTYFKIYSPSKAGRLLSVYESAPDQFDFSQSWGWRSSTLMLDEGMLDNGDDDEGDGIGGKKGKGSVLRFMVVIGNL
jgi:hypothetical protein